MIVGSQKQAKLGTKIKLLLWFRFCTLIFVFQARQNKGPETAPEATIPPRRKQLTTLNSSQSNQHSSNVSIIFIRSDSPKQALRCLFFFVIFLKMKNILKNPLLAFVYHGLSN